MSNIYVPIRAFGDFTITTAVVKNHFNEKLPIILPAYLKDLYNILGGSAYYTIIDEIALERSPAFFELHKIKNPSDVTRLMKEVLFINKHLDHKNNYLFDYDSKRLNIFFKHFLYPEKSDNIYRAKIKLLENFLVKKEASTTPVIEDKERKKAVFFPGSRKASKVVDPNLVEAIVNSGVFDAVDLCYHSSENPPPEAIVFTDSEKLKDVVTGYDFVISADSLPVHMAYYYNVPHFCINNGYLNSPWLTPYCEEKEYYTVYTGDIPATVDEIKRKLHL